MWETSNNPYGPAVKRIHAFRNRMASPLSSRDWIERLGHQRGSRRKTKYLGRLWRRGVIRLPIRRHEPPRILCFGFGIDRTDVYALW